MIFGYIRVNKWKNSNIGLTPELANLTHFWRNDFHAVSTKYNLDQKREQSEEDEDEEAFVYLR